jgi:hypothetical protein
MPRRHVPGQACRSQADFTGNYQEYEADKRMRRGEEAVRTHRIRFKPLK